MREREAAARQQAQWLLWQMGSVETVRVQEEEPTEPVAAPVQTITIPHRRYDAVISRMKQAGQRTGAFTAWS